MADIFRMAIEESFDEKLQVIIEHFGQDAQKRKFHTEVGELEDAMLKYDFGIEPTNAHITKEWMDVMFIMLQIKKMYNIVPEEVFKLMLEQPDITMLKYNVNGCDNTYGEDENDN